MIHPNSSEQLVFRQVAFPVSAFDYLKDFQRDIERQTGQRLNNNQVLARILAEHRQSNVDSEEHVSTRSQVRT
ncbi:hypothetical protein [Ferribacterium limneticum]|uniref:hypothetical protein n=1 Tax=Ferribacterium limneticum TaxID=76259 RepID=UPI001CF86650|nr:hypothetical protein [Ferribacterium limneticum]UCV22514.1 hypothetical protein KI613_18690 [Ferribacterium limneticum]